MTIYDSEKHHRKSIRLQDYDYSASGFYFVTICIKNMECLFGNIVNSIVNLSDFGVIASNLWQEIPDNFDGVEIDEFIIMPNHIHGIIKITCRGLINQTPTLMVNSPTTLITNELESNISDANNLMKSDKYLLGKIIRYFKAKTTKKIRDNNFYFQWQKNYYEHIIKSEESLNSIRIYILNNPSRWILEKQITSDYKLKNKIEGY